MAQPARKAMTSEAASIVKKAGHSNESDFASLIGGIVIKGNGKADVSKDTFKFSLKKVCNRIQVALYSRNSKNWSESSTSAMICKDILSIYPPSFEEYQANKPFHKALLQPKMVAFKDHLSKPENLKEYLRLVFTNSGDVHYIVMKDGSNQYIFDAEEAIDTIVNHAKVVNSSARKPGDTPEQKVLVTIPNGPSKYRNLLELEIRNSSAGHYAEFLCVCNRNPLFNLLNTHILDQAILKGVIIVCGNAISNASHF
jgi:hypothetical protein